MSAEDVNRIIGALIEFKQSAEKRFDDLELQISQLQESRWKRQGASDVRTVVISTLMLVAAGVVKYVADRVWG